MRNGILIFKFNFFSNVVMVHLRSAIGVEQSSKILLSVDERETFASQDGNREWATFIECIRITGGNIPSFLIVKGQYILEDISQLFNDSCAKLAVSENEWTDDNLDLV
jgi:hypothetical protein